MSVLPAREAKVRAYFDEINVETLVPSAKTTLQSIAPEILEVDAPALVLRKVSREIVLGGGRSFADGGDVLPDLGRQDIDVMRIPWIVAADPASGSGSADRAEQQRARQQT